jgi:hypothetical protein
MPSRKMSKTKKFITAQLDQRWNVQIDRLDELSLNATMYQQTYVLTETIHALQVLCTYMVEYRQQRLLSEPGLAATSRVLYVNYIQTCERMLAAQHGPHTLAWTLQVLDIIMDLEYPLPNGIEGWLWLHVSHDESSIQKVLQWCRGLSTRQYIVCVLTLTQTTFASPSMQIQVLSRYALYSKSFLREAVSHLKLDLLVVDSLEQMATKIKLDLDLAYSCLSLTSFIKRLVIHLQTIRNHLKSISDTLLYSAETSQILAELLPYLYTTYAMQEEEYAHAHRIVLICLRLAHSGAMSATKHAFPLGAMADYYVRLCSQHVLNAT